MGASSVLAFWGIAALLIAVPGADWAFTLGTCLRGQSLLAAVAGLMVGYAGMTVVVAAGVGAVATASPGVLTGLSVVGGLYLMWHGATTGAKPLANPAGQVPTGAFRATFLRGIGVSGLNPKGLVIFLALLPQFTDRRGSWPLSGQICFLGMVFVLSCGAFYLAFGSVVRTALNSHPSIAGSVTRLSGAAMVLLGMVVILERLIR